MWPPPWFFWLLLGLALGLLADAIRMLFRQRVRARAKALKVWESELAAERDRLSQRIAELGPLGPPRRTARRAKPMEDPDNRNPFLMAAPNAPAPEVPRES